MTLTDISLAGIWWWQWYGNGFRIPGPLWGESTGQYWIPNIDAISLIYSDKGVHYHLSGTFYYLLYTRAMARWYIPVLFELLWSRLGMNHRRRKPRAYWYFTYWEISYMVIIGSGDSYLLLRSIEIYVPLLQRISGLSGTLYTPECALNMQETHSDW